MVTFLMEDVDAKKINLDDLIKLMVGINKIPNQSQSSV
ncbi:hypothetical protein QGQ_0886 [Clostridioides difficile 342]|nr:hypothetical protein QAO_0866 [Clostridioides difficile CD3]EQE21897.1 hypothetical protein QAY_0873 [Clostridioides difficile CD18]EQE22440.1 hypothetical protein QAW_1142 [Clostridioides difficile CD17]EQE37638.1 hypothetical protein QC7_0994 [Clostridioides difficile CD38]EQE44982.1 hypothetical protein QCC_0893 [Clostridioides difficile CD41]EQE50695.1 hypothetical protein QC9_0848 [Clostridioides difficile CD39]EQE56653.1 hypothetical protein QCE_0860 [Clostridioides difficile CD42]E